MIVVDGTDFLVDGVKKGTVTEGKKQMVAMQTKVLVWPDKVYYDTASDEFLEMDITQTSATATFTNSTLTLDSEVKFKKGDGVQITGCKEEQNNRFVVIEEVEGNKIPSSMENRRTNSRRMVGKKPTSPLSAKRRNSNLCARRTIDFGACTTMQLPAQS